VQEEIKEMQRANQRNAAGKSKKCSGQNAAK